MVQALVKLNMNTNRVLNIIKAKYELKNKSEAIEYVVNRYIKYENEPELRQDFIEKMKNKKARDLIRVEDPSERYGLDV